MEGEESILGAEEEEPGLTFSIFPEPTEETRKKLSRLKDKSESLSGQVKRMTNKTKSNKKKSQSIQLKVIG